MAINNLIRQIQNGVNSHGFYNAMVNLLKISKIHVVEIDIDESAKLLRKAVFQAVRDYHRGKPDVAAAYIKQYKDAFGIIKFIDAIADLIEKFNSNKRIFENTTGRYKFRPNSTLFTGVVRDTQTFKPGVATFIVPISSPHFPAVDYVTFIKNFRNASFNFWLLSQTAIMRNKQFRTVSHSQRLVGGRGLKRPYKRGATRDKEFLVGTHDPITVPIGWIELKGHQIQAAINANISEIDIVRRMIDAFDIDFEEHPDYKDSSGALETKRVMTIKLGQQNVDMYYDLKFVQNIIDALTDAKYNIFWRTYAMDPEEALEAIASPSFKQQAAQAAQYKILRDLMKKHKKYGKLTAKIKTTKPSIKKREASLKKGKRPKKATKFNVRLPQQVNIQEGVEGGQGKEASTSVAADLARLRVEIDNKLSAEVRRNMGRPSLQNRTGRFSNSVKLLSLTEAKNTIMAKYTYLLSPYQTFENTGKKRWPMAYNPKPLIAKSIRNLAQGRIEQKLTVRRV